MEKDAHRRGNADGETRRKRADEHDAVADVVQRVAEKDAPTINVRMCVVVRMAVVVVLVGEEVVDTFHKRGSERDCGEPDKPSAFFDRLL